MIPSRRSMPIHILVRPEEHAAIVAQAERERMSVSTCLRRLVCQTLADQLSSPAPAPQSASPTAQ